MKLKVTDSDTFHKAMRMALMSKEEGGRQKIILMDKQKTCSPKKILFRLTDKINLN